MQNRKQIRKIEPQHRSEDMSQQPSTARIASAPLYASPWLAFFYLIIKSWSTSSPEPESEG